MKDELGGLHLKEATSNEDQAEWSHTDLLVYGLWYILSLFIHSKSNQIELMICFTYTRKKAVMPIILKVTHLSRLKNLVR